MVCVELAWPSPSMTDKTPCGAHCSQPSLVLVCWISFTHGGDWDFCTDMWVWIFHADFLVRIFWCGFLGADVFRGFLGADFFADFAMACAGFWRADFCCGFFGLFFRRKSPEKIALKNPTEKSSPKI